MAIFEIAKNGIWSEIFFVKLIYLIPRVFLPGFFDYASHFFYQTIPTLSVIYFTMDESTDPNNTVFLLQRLQELKNWQKQQEEKLLQDQEFQMAEFLQKSPEEDVGLPTDDEDTKLLNCFRHSQKKSPLKFVFVGTKKRMLERFQLTIKGSHLLNHTLFLYLLV